MNFIQRLVEYVSGKRSEIKQMDHRDLYAAKVITEIQARKHSETTRVLPIEDILYFHPINRESALEKVREREQVIRQYESELREQGVLTKEWMREHLSSLTYCKVVPYGDKFVAYEGNGRLMAIRNVIPEGIGIEVDYIDIPNSLERKIRKVRQKNGIESTDS